MARLKTVLHFGGSTAPNVANLHTNEIAVNHSASGPALYIKDDQCNLRTFPDIDAVSALQGGYLHTAGGTMSGNILPGTTNSYSIGNSTYYFNNGGFYHEYVSDITAIGTSGEITVNSAMVPGKDSATIGDSDTYFTNGYFLTAHTK